MKTENTLRMVRNSLLCFFMALGAGFLVACGGSGSPSPATSTPQPFLAYLVDTAVEGVEYSGPTGDGLTGKGGVFSASEGVFVFSIGGTTLGRVQMSSNQENNEVTPSDFLDVNEAQAITIARIMQGLDEDGTLTNGISISESTRDNAPDLFADISRHDALGSDVVLPVVINSKTFMIPPKSEATDHLVATRKCLFSGGYAGNFEGTLLSNGAELRGQSYYAVEPFASPPRVRRFTSGGNFESFETSTVGVIGSTIVLTVGNTLSFITPRLVAGEWQYPNDGRDIISSGTHNNLTPAEDTGNPGATRRIVGVETTGTGTTVVGMYVLDYFEEATVFLGRYYGVNATVTINAVSSMPLSLTIANGASWPVSADGPADGTMAVTLTLSGMRGGDAVSITLGIVRAESLENANENYGKFDGVFADGVDSQLSGTWCDIGGAVGSTVAPTPSPRTPPAPSASAQSDTEIEVTWSAVPRATVYKLYRSESSGVSGSQVGGDISALSYLDSGRSANTEYFYQLEACNSGGCSRRSPEVSATTQVASAPSGGGGGAPSLPQSGGMCGVGDVLMIGDSCTWRQHTISVSSSGIGIAGPIFNSDPTDPAGLVRYTIDSSVAFHADQSGSGPARRVTRAD